MRGSIIRRSKSSWALVVDIGRDEHGKRRQRWHRFAVDPKKTPLQNQKQAHAKLRELLHQLDTATYVDVSKQTFLAYLRQWAEKTSPLHSPQTTRTYADMIAHVSSSSIAHKPLQKITASDLEHLYATATPKKKHKNSNGKLSPATIGLLHTVIRQALQLAVRDHVLPYNPARDATSRPKRTKRDARRTARERCWNGDEARAVIAAAKADSPRLHAFFALAIDSGMRKSELLGLQWRHVDLDKATITIEQQLAQTAYTVAAFTPTKTDNIRTITIGAQTVSALREHRRRQAELKMANRTRYQDFDLVFGKEHIDLQRPSHELGQPCQAIMTLHFRRVLKAAGVKSINVHGMRHTSASLTLHRAGVPVKVVADRLGHAKASMTLDVYAHSDDDAQQSAAERLDDVLSGTR
jgi:integrase